MDNIYLLVAIVGAIGFLVSGVTGIIQAIGTLSSGSVQPHHQKWLYFAIIAFLVVSVVFGGATYLTARSSSPTRTGTTPTSVPTNTPPPQPTSAEGIPTDPQKLYDQVTSGTPVFDDHLTHQDGLNWAEGRQCSFTQGSYHAYDPYRSPPHSIECLAQTSNSSANFAFQATMTIIRGDKGGLLFGYGGTNSRKYRFTIDQNGDYDLFAPELGRSLVSGSSPLIKQGLNQLNVLTVIVKGNIIYLYIQGKYVNQVTILSGTSVSGEIGLFSDLQQSSTSPTEVVFSDAEVWIL